MRSLLVVALCVPAGSAGADKKSKALVDVLAASFGGYDGTMPAFAVVNDETKVNPDKVLLPMDAAWEPYDPVVAFSADGSDGWIAAGLGDVVVCGMGDCEKVRRDEERRMKRAPPYHASGLVDGDQPVFVHFGRTGSGTGYGDPMAMQVDDAAKPAVELFDKTIGDPKAFAATVSSRKDVALLGTEANERFVGGDTVRATLVKWGLALTKVGGIRAGATKSKTIVWLAADVDARAKKSTKPTPYRVTAIYEKTGGDWKIVQLHFS